MFPNALSAAELQAYQAAVTQSLGVRSHFDVLNWLQGDMQRYVPHDIMIAAWGSFQGDHIRHDILSAMAGVRTHNSASAPITPLLVRLFDRWNGFGRKPYALNAGERGFLLYDSGLQSTLGEALSKMRSAMVHGIHDARGSHHCLYVTFSGRDTASEGEQGAFGVVLPYIDMALRQVQHLPHQTCTPPGHGAALDGTGDSGTGASLGSVRHAHVPAPITQRLGLTEREAEILHWVALGKTNPVIGSILGISEYTVKNHMQRLFRKLDVSNRAQAVGRLQEPLQAHALLQGQGQVHHA